MRARCGVVNGSQTADEANSIRARSRASDNALDHAYEILGVSIRARSQKSKCWRAEIGRRSASSAISTSVGKGEPFAGLGREALFRVDPRCRE